MHIWRAAEFGDPLSVLTLEHMELPEPGEGLLELAVEATGVGLPDALMVRGNYPAVRKPPVTPGQEVTGTVVRVGPGCSVRPGDRVIASTRFAEGLGGFAERTLVFEQAALSVPPGLSAEQAAGFFVPFHTGYVGVIQRGQLQAGETLLVLGGAGSSGSAAIQLGKAVGATVIATASDPDKAALCRSLGADHVINHRETAIHDGVRDIVGRGGVQMIFDPVGGDAYAQAVKAIARHGRVILIGYSSGRWPAVDPLNVVLRSYSLIGAFPGARTLEETRRHHDDLCRLVSAGKIRVPVDRIFPFDQVPQAIHRVDSGRTVGKVVVQGAVSGEKRRDPAGG
jgi:NADPH2:quinone reductase